MAVVIDSITPPRGRVGDTFVIDGSGFSATDNAVDVINTAGTTIGQTISVQSATQITFTLSGAVASEDFHVILRVTNNDDTATNTRFLFIEKAYADLIADDLSSQQPGQFEDYSAEAERVAEAKDWERLASRIEGLRDQGSGILAGAEGIGTLGSLFTNFTAPRNSVQGALEGINSALGVVSGGMQVFFGQFSAVTSYATGSLGFDPVAAFVLSTEGNKAQNIALVTGTGSSDQSVLAFTLSGFAGSTTAGRVAFNNAGTTYWACTAFASSGVTIGPGSGSLTLTGAILVLGNPT